MSLPELTAIVVFTGIIMVFIILFILTLVTYIYGKTVNIVRAKFIRKKTIKDSNQQFYIKNDNSTQNIDEEIISVIAASIYESGLFSPTNHKIKSISLSNNNFISSWKLTGLLENTNSYKNYIRK